MLSRIVFCVFFSVWAAGNQAVELQPSFANFALHPTPDVPLDESIARAARAFPDESIPFTWNQTAVVRQASNVVRAYRGFDPGFQPVLVEIQPTSPTNVSVVGFSGEFGIQEVQTLPKTAGLKEVFQFRVIARDIRSELATFTYDIRDETSKLRSAPILSRSPGEIVRPGQFVRFVWTQTTNNERFPKCEAEFSGRTGPAKGLSRTVITQVLGIKVQPYVLGHYLMLVTPREVRGEAPRGPNSNGQVFRCAFGSADLAPVADGFLADTFLPAVNQVVTLQPNAIDPETGRAVFNNQFYEFGDGTNASGINGPVTHAYTQPGIYRVRCAVSDDAGLTATTEDTVIVGATKLDKIVLSLTKYIPPEEAGIGVQGEDMIKATFVDPSGLRTGPGDRIVFSLNRNHFGRTSVSDNGDITDIILKNGSTFTGPTKVAKGFTVTVSGGTTITVSVRGAQLDRTGDPRFGRSELKGIFENQRIALAVIPADGSTPRVLVYNGNVQCKLKGGQAGRGQFLPEEKLTGIATQLLPDPKKQEP